MDYIKDQTVNTYNAPIIEALNTPEKRSQMAKKLVNQFFNLAFDEVFFWGLKCFDKISENGDASIYWTFAFRIDGFTYSGGTSEGDLKLHTITIDNKGGVDFNLHRYYIR